MRALAVIPCRNGSRRLPGKNTADLGGKPLLDWTIEAAKESWCFSELVGSTNSDEIESMLLNAGCKAFRSTLHDEPDGAPMPVIVREALGTLPLWGYDTVVLLQPTSPFRTAEDIRAALTLMEERDADAVVSVCSVPVLEVGHADRLRPCERANVVGYNGAIYAIKRSVLEAGADWDTAALVYAYRMPLDRSIDIDTIYDLEVARCMVAQAA